MAAGARIKIIDRKCRITLPGGDLMMEWRESDDHVLMTGPVAYEFDGVLPSELAA
jgi:diaminopimelate epimerase